MLTKELLRDSNDYLNSHFNQKKCLPGLYTGSFGILLYNRYFHSISKGDYHPGGLNFEQLTSEAFEHINNANFSMGLSGQLWVLQNLHKNKFIQIDEKEIHFFSKYIQDELLLLTNLRQLDNLHGAFGILYYLISLDEVDEICLNTFLSLCKEIFYIKSNFKYIKTKVHLDTSVESYNLSLSHGIAGNILILSKALTKFPKNELLKKILSDMVDFLLRFIETEAFGRSSNQLIKNNTYEHTTKGRLAWCYGELGAGLALYRYSNAVKDKQVEEMSIQILLSAAKKRGLRECNVSDAPLCHGTSGIMHIFNRLSFETGLIDFKNSRDYWFEETINFYRRKGISGFACASINSQHSSELKPSFLTGIAGIVLSILSKENPTVEPKWDGCLFLD